LELYILMCVVDSPEIRVQVGLLSRRSAGRGKTNLPVMTFLFVYGTLRPAVDHPRIRHLVARLKPIGSGRIPGRLVYLGQYPGVSFDVAAAGTVVGDVVEPADDALLAEIDAYEGFDPARPDAGEYIRRKRPVEVDGVKTVECWLYELRAVPAHATWIESGDYVAWLKEQRTA
jgi:gamma-glutamylcyclotransferase (GGCT)/AIG2-like uncharacterized protein YtfP